MESMDRKFTDATTAGPEMVTPGVVAKIMNRDGKTLYEASVGTYGVDRTENIQPETQMWLASETKILTATLAMKLVENGLWKLDDPVEDILPELKGLPVVDMEGKVIKEVAENKITLRHLVTHSSGLSYLGAHPGANAWRAANGITSAPGFEFLNEPVEKYLSGPLIFEPGNGFSYGPGLDVTGILISRVTKKPLEDLLQEQICKPLGMVSTTFTSPNPENLMNFSDRTSGTLKTIPLVYRPSSNFHGGHGVFSTVSDYTKFLAILLRDGEGINGARILKKETVDKMFTPQLNADGVAMLKEAVASFVGPAMAPSVSLAKYKDVNINHGISGVINVEDYSDGRKAGSMAWSGVPNLYWWIDRKSGILANLATQIFPVADGPMTSLAQIFEDEVYKNLLK